MNRTLAERRRGHAVRGADRGRLPRARQQRRRGGRDRGGPRRPLRRHERDPLEGAGADHGRARAHALARARRSRTSRARSSRWCATTRRSSPGRSCPRRARGRSRGRGGASRQSRRGHGAVARSAAGRAATSSAGTSPSRRPPPRPSSAKLDARDGLAVAGGARGRGCRGGSSRSPTRPLTLIDGAHNPDGRRGPGRGARRASGSTGVVAILDDKDAAAMLRDAAAAVRAGRLHALAQPARAAAGHARVALRPAGRARRPRVVPDPKQALARARELAGPDGAVLATGSIYLIADLVRERAARERPHCEP